MIKGFLPPQYSLGDAKFANEDLTGDGQDELVFMARPKETTKEPDGEVLWIIYLGAITNNEGNPKQVLGTEFALPYYPLGLKCWGEWATINGFNDLYSGGKKEIADLGLSCPGASTIGHNLFLIDWDRGEIVALMIRSYDGVIGPASFAVGGGRGLGSSFSFEDKNKDSIQELVLTVRTEGFYDWEYQDTVYVWKNNMFVYNKELSDSKPRNISQETYRNEEYGFEIDYVSSPNNNYNSLINTTSYTGFCDLGQPVVSIEIYSATTKPNQDEFNGDVFLAVNIKNNPGNLSIDDWVARNCQNDWPSNAKKENTKIAGIDAVKLIGNQIEVGEAEDQPLLIFKKGGLLYFLHPYGDREAFEDMLSSFRFFK